MRSFVFRLENFKAFWRGFIGGKRLKRKVGLTKFKGVSIYKFWEYDRWYSDWSSLLLWSPSWVDISNSVKVLLFVQLLNIKEKIKIFLKMFDAIPRGHIAMVWFKRLFPRPIRAVDSKYSLVHSIMQIIWLIARLIENDIRRWVGLFRFHQDSEFTWIQTGMLNSFVASRISIWIIILFMKILISTFFFYYYTII